MVFIAREAKRELWNERIRAFHASGYKRKVWCEEHRVSVRFYMTGEPCLDMKQDTRLRCRIHMHEFFEGVTVRTVCDNLKAGVIRHPKEGDIVLDEAHEALGSHYRTAMPTGVRKPKAKASVDGTVDKVAIAIIASLRNEVFYSLQSLWMAI